MWIEDLRYAIRSLRSRPGLLLIAALTLAVGIGAATSIFSIVDAVLLRPLPFPREERIISFISFYSQHSMRGAFSPPTFVDFRSRLKSFRTISLTSPWNANLTGIGEPERVQGQLVSANFFDTFSVNPALGRRFLPDEENEGKDHVLILSNEFWNLRFGSDPKIIGKQILLNDSPYTVIGVMPPQFSWARNYGKHTDVAVWAPFALTSERLAEDQRGNEFLDLLGRLNDGVSLDQAQAEILTVVRQMHQQHRDHYQLENGWILKLLPIKEDMTSEVRPFLIVLMLAVGLMLLIACNNIAGLLLLRGSERQREMAIRTALGAARFRMARQLFFESLLMALAGGVLGLALGGWCLRLFVSVEGEALPRASEIAVNYRFFFTSIFLTLIAAGIFGILPALRLSARPSFAALKEGGRSSTAGLRQHRTINALVISQVSISLVLLIGAGLLLQSFTKITGVDPGFRPDNLLTLRLALSANRYPIERRGPFFHLLLQRLAALPGVRAAGATSNLPMSEDLSSCSFYPEGMKYSEGDTLPEAENWVTTPGYFETMKIRLLSGRVFTEFDSTNSPRVVVIDEVMAKRYWPHQNPIGKRMDYEGDSTHHQWCEIVGIVGQIKQRSLTDLARPQFYVPYNQLPLRNMSVVLRTELDPRSLAAAARQSVFAVDSNQPVYRMETMNQLISGSLTPNRVAAVLMAAFALFALLLSALGIFGVLASAVANRTHEIGIRMILGASPAAVLKMVLKRTFILALAGIVVGVPAALVATHSLTTLLFQVDTYDPRTYVSVTTVILFVSLLAGFFPARRATRIQPTVALRYE